MMESSPGLDDHIVLPSSLSGVVVGTPESSTLRLSDVEALLGVESSKWSTASPSAVPHHNMNDGGDDRKEETLSEILAHSELEELREWFHSTLLKMQALAQERDYNAAKVNALTNVLAVKTADETTALLQETSLKVAELSWEVERLKLQLHQSNNQVARLEQEKEANRSMLVELSSIFRAQGGSLVKNLHSEVEEEVEDNPDVITPAMACDLTIRSLKSQVEGLEDERGELLSEMMSLQSACQELRQENEARAIKIAALEKQFHSINQAREMVVTRIMKKTSKSDGGSAPPSDDNSSLDGSSSRRGHRSSRSMMGSRRGKSSSSGKS